MSEVVAQLLEIRERLAATAVIAMRSKADADHSYHQYTEAAKGSDHPRLQGAKADITIAGDKSARIARLLNEAREHVTKYLQRIAPSSIPDDSSPVMAEPSGEQLLEDADNRANAKASAASFLRRAVRNAENVQDQTKTVTELGEKGVKILRSPSGPSGSQSAGTTTPSATAPISRPKIEAPEAAGHFIVLGIITAVAIQRTDRHIRKAIARWRNRERTNRAD